MKNHSNAECRLAIGGKRSQKATKETKGIGEPIKCGMQNTCWGATESTEATEGRGCHGCGINNGRIVHRDVSCISNLSGTWRSALLGGDYHRNTCITSSTAMVQQSQPLVFWRGDLPERLGGFHPPLHVSPLPPFIPPRPLPPPPAPPPPILPPPPNPPP